MTEKSEAFLFLILCPHFFGGVGVLFVCFINFFVYMHIFRESERNLELRASMFPENEHISGLKRPLCCSYLEKYNKCSLICLQRYTETFKIDYLLNTQGFHTWNPVRCLTFYWMLKHHHKIAFKSWLFKSHGLRSHLHLLCVFIHPLAPKQLKDSWKATVRSDVTN